MRGSPRFLVVTLGLLVFAASCGSETSSDPDVPPDVRGDTIFDAKDAGKDLPWADLSDPGPGTDVSPDAAPDAGNDTSPVDVEPDGVAPDAEPDAEPDAPVGDEATGDVPPADAQGEDVPGDAGGDAVSPEGCPVDPAPVGANGACKVTPGSTWTLIRGDLLAPEGILRNQTLLVDPTGLIACVGCCLKEPSAAGATRIECGQNLVSPGLINAHDHISYTGNAPKAHGTIRYDHRHQWRKGDGSEYPKIPVPSTGGDAWGELRNLMAGATSILGSGGAGGLMRNLDKTLETGIDSGKTVDFDTFPLGDSGGEMLTSGCGYPSLPVVAEVAAKPCYAPHVAEGVNQAAQNEFACLSSSDNGGRDIMNANLAVIHGIGVRANDIALMASRGTSLVWSPRSNVDLYGDTADVPLYHRLGVNVALGTDWTASGSMNIVRELKCADQLNTVQFGTYFTDREIVEMALSNAARAVHMDDRIGALKPGLLADIAVFSTASHADERAILDAAPQDVLLVLRGGLVLYGDASTVAALPNTGTGCETLEVCGRTQSVCAKRETGKAYASLAPSGAYALFFCNAPADEPSCTPFRAQRYDGQATQADLDGDGIPNDQDDCPSIFNPVRPMDNGKQADFDGDGVGDACDVCPLNANTTDCKAFDPNDRDGDGTPNALDNCPDRANDQADQDKDGKGDLCDPCPEASNPGNAGCPASIYDLKQGKVADGNRVRVVDAVVTGVGNKAGVTQGFFVQVRTDDPAYTGADFSGLYCYGPSTTPMPKAGDRVTLDGTITTFYGEKELTSMTVQVLSSGNAVPEPVVALPADVTTGGSRAAALEGVLVKVQNVVVTSIAPAPGAGDAAPTNEFAVDAGLRVNDFIHLIAAFPAVGDTFTSLAGVLRFANDNSKLEPRDESDIVAVPPVPKLKSFGPALVYAKAETTGPTLPELKVTLTRAPEAELLVQVVSDDPNLVALPDGGAIRILPGTTEGSVPVQALVAGANPVTLTATYDGVSLQAKVRVVGPAELPKVVAFDPASLDVVVGKDATASVVLDLPSFDAALTVPLAIDPTGIATIPASVEIPAGALSAPVTVSAVAKGDATVTAVLNGDPVPLAVHVTEAPVVVGGVFISEYVEGSSNNKALEIFNAGTAPVALASLTVKLFSNGAATASFSTPLGTTGEIAPGATFVVCHSSAVAGILDRCQLKWATLQHNGDDALSLEQDGQVVDVFGQIGNRPDATGWGGITTDRTLRRKCGIAQGDAVGSDTFDPTVQWDAFPKDTFDGLGAHTVPCP